MARVNRTTRRMYYKWDHCFRSRTTPTKFFCAVFYVAIISFVLTAYFWQYPSQPLNIANVDPGIDAVVRGLKETTRLTEKQPEALVKHTTVKVPQPHVNSTEAPPTTQAVQGLESKNWAGGGYESIPGNKLLDRKCRTCAVVTSSGHLKGSKEGANIDSADCVIRMNAAPSLKYEKDVGSRTTFRVIGHRNFPSMFKKEESQRYHITNATTKSDYIIVTWLYGVNLKKNTPYKMCQVLGKKYKNFACYLGTDETMNRNLDLFYNELGISRDKIKLWLSTGWTTMLFALEVCDKMDVYGMVYDGYCDEHPNDKTMYHYYDRVRSECSYYSRSERKATGGHKFLTEKIVFGKWANLYNITFHRPSWKDHMVRYNRSTSIDSPYKRIYHYLQWKQEHEDKNSNKTDKVEEDKQKTMQKDAANITIRNKKKPAEKPKEEPLADGNEDSPAAGNDTMKSENIMVAIPADGAGVVVVDRETGKEVRVAKTIKKRVVRIVKQKKDKVRRTNAGKTDDKTDDNAKLDEPGAAQKVNDNQHDSPSDSNLPAKKER